MYLLVGDLHIGNIYSDIKTFLKLVDKAKTELVANYVSIVFVGDMFDGFGMYRSQDLEHIHPDIDIERTVGRYVAEWLMDFREVIMLLGNHEINKRGDGLFYQGMSEVLGDKLKVVDEYIDCTNGLAVVHYSIKSSRGSRYNGQSPLGIYSSMVDIDRIEKQYKCRIKYYVSGHIHKSLGIYAVGDYLLISLPSFLNKDDKDRYRHKPYIIYLDPFMNIIRLFEGEYRPSKEIIRDNIELVYKALSQS